MTKFEAMINEGIETRNVIDCIINNLVDGGAFNALINADTIAEIDRRLPQGYELDKISTLCNYFDRYYVEKFDIEIVNSQYIYFEKFTKLYDGGFYRYIDAMKANDFNTTMKLDRKFQQ